MTTIAKVKIWDTLVGAVVWDDATGLASFEYDKRFERGNWDVAPLMMPIRSRHQVYTFPALRRKDVNDLSAFNGIPGLLADSLPDKYGNDMINSWLAMQGREPNSMNPVEKLCFIGQRAMGALQFEPVIDSGNNEVFQVEIDSLVDIASQMLQNRSSFATNFDAEEVAIRKILSIGSSVGGARPKAVVAINWDTNEVLSGQCDAPEGFQQWLIKLDGVSDSQLGSTHGWGRVEYAYYLMATACGVDMMPCRLLEENGRAHFLTKRYDRVAKNERLHTQTMCAIAHMDFNNNRSFSYEQLFQIMRQLNLTYQEVEQMYRRMVFNVFTRNCDDHTKNHSFLMDKSGKWRLAPAYDICFAYSPTNKWVQQHALSINYKREKFTMTDLLTIAKLVNCRKPNKIIEEVRAAVEHWQDFAMKAQVNSELTKLIQENILVDVVD